MSSAYWVGVRMETAMSLVTWSPAIGITAVWRIAPCANTARSVVPPPMSTRQTPSSFSSSVSTEKLEASCSSTTSSTSSPQRLMHFSMFCAALSAPVTMCTLASSRTPDMPMGSRMPSWPSTMNSWGSTCRIFWSAGIATAFAASITCSTSPWVTSRSRIATTPCELRLRTWLPAIPANTEWISQPAMSSASSTARWIDCTVDSMLTTTPFFRPREGWEPSPSTSMVPSTPTSPTRATTLEVPMSRPTMRFLSDRLSMTCTCPPTDREAVCVAHIHVRNVSRAPLDDGERRAHEFLEPLIDLRAPEPHRDAVGEIEVPGAARIEPQRRDREAHPGQPPLHGEVALGDLGLGTIRSRQTRESGGDAADAGRKHHTAAVDQAIAAPARGGYLLHDQNRKPVGPVALDARGIDPGQRVYRPAHRREIDREQALSAHPSRDDLLDLGRGDVLEPSRHLHGADRLVERPEHDAEGRKHRPAGGEHPDDGTPGDRRPRRGFFAGFDPIARPLPHGQRPPPGNRTKLVSSTRHTSSSKSMPAARAAIGTRLWPVIPGTVLTSRRSARPAASIMKSARPQPSPPTAASAASARLARCCSAGRESPEGQR